MTKPVVITPRAQQHISEIDTWWRKNRDKAPDRFEEELTIALGVIETIPGAGRRYRRVSTTRDVRRVFLRVTRHHVYYVEEADRVLVVAVWGSVKEAVPDLRDA